MIRINVWKKIEKSILKFLSILIEIYLKFYSSRNLTLLFYALENKLKTPITINVGLRCPNSPYHGF